MDLLKNLLFTQVKQDQFTQLKDEWKKVTKPLEQGNSSREITGPLGGRAFMVPESPYDTGNQPSHEINKVTA